MQFIKEKRACDMKGKAGVIIICILLVLVGIRVVCIVKWMNAKKDQNNCGEAKCLGKKVSEVGKQIKDDMSKKKDWSDKNDIFEKNDISEKDTGIASETIL